MDKRIEKMRAWGCDIESAMDRMLNDEEFYLDCLSTIPDDENFCTLKEKIAAGDIKAAFDCAHTLKGVLANLGITPMYNKTVEIVEPLRAGSCEGLLSKTDELFALKDELADILNS